MTRDWKIEKNKAGYQMVNSVQRLEEMKAFIRMAGGADLKRPGWNGNGTGTNGDVAKHIAGLPGIEQDSTGNFALGRKRIDCRGLNHISPVTLGSPV
jgi:hypothetical protein